MPAAGTNRRVPVVGSGAVRGRGRVAVVPARQDAAGCRRSLAAVATRRGSTGRAVSLVVDNGACPTRTLRRRALADRAAGVHVVWLARYSPQFTTQEREWRYLKRAARRHLARTLRTVVDEVVAGRQRLGGERREVLDAVPDWFIAGHRRPPTGRPPGRPPGAKDSHPRAKRRQDLPAPT